MDKKRVYSHEERTSDKWITLSFLFLPVCTLSPQFVKEFIVY